jgi:hypothetical protein
MTFRAGIERALVGRLHDRGPAARADHELALAVLDDRLFAREPRELVGLVDNISPWRRGSRPPAARLGQVVGAFERGLDRLRRGDARRPVDHQGRADPGFVEQHFGLEQLQLEPDRAQFLAQQEIAVLEGQFVGRILGLRRGMRLRFGELRLLLRRIEVTGGALGLAGFWLGGIGHGLSDRQCPAMRQARSVARAGDCRFRKFHRQEPSLGRRSLVREQPH